MNFLLSNDDGYQAPGIRELAKSLAKIGNVVIVAPEENKSASSSSFNLKKSINHYRSRKKYLLHQWNTN